MSKIQWEYDLAEKPFREQLQAMGWQWIEGDTDVPELSERVNFREVLLKGRLEAALKRINLRDGEPWLDETRAAAEELAALGAEQGDRPGTPLFFRKPEQRPPDLRGKEGATLQSQQILAAGMLRPAHLLDLMRNFSVFQQVDGKTRKVVARYQQFRAIHKAVTRLQEGRTLLDGAPRDERGDPVRGVSASERVASDPYPGGRGAPFPHAHAAPQLAQGAGQQPGARSANATCRALPYHRFHQSESFLCEEDERAVGGDSPTVQRRCGCLGACSA